MRPLHGDNLPAPAQIKVDVKDAVGGYTVQVEDPGASKKASHSAQRLNIG